MGVVQAQAVFGDEAGEEAGVDAAGDVVAGGDGEEGAGVVDEFYPEAWDDAATPSTTNEAAQPTAGNQTLRTKLSRRHASSMSMQSKQGMGTHPGEAHGAG